VSAVEDRVRAELESRRDRLATAAAERGEERLVELLRRVDSALEHVEHGSWGLCAACAVAIEPELLAADPLVSVCLECLSEEDRRALERDLEGAARVQQRLLPPPTLEHDGWELAWLWEPRSAVSGDHVDVLTAAGPEEPLHLLVGDVAGKGVAASLLQSQLHALFRALATPQVGLAALVTRVNRLFAQATGLASYATLVATRLHPDGTAELVNAGHPRPLVADRRGVRPVEGAGLPLGMFRDSEYVAHELRLAAGQVLLLYTDGLTEALAGGEEYGVGRAAAALRRHASMPLDELLRACRAELEEFLAGGRRDDDLTLVALRRTK